jgi:hypothetical protein
MRVGGGQLSAYQRLPVGNVIQLVQRRLAEQVTTAGAPGGERPGGERPGTANSERAPAMRSLRARITAFTSERNLLRVSNLQDATKMCETIIRLIEAALHVTAYASRLPAFHSKEGAKGDMPEAALTYFIAVEPQHRNVLLHKALHKEECVLTYEAQTLRRTVHVSHTSHERQVHFWLGPTARATDGHLLLIPLCPAPTHPSLGVLAVDTLQHAEGEGLSGGGASDDFVKVEVEVLEFAAQRMAACLVRAKDGQTELHSRFLEQVRVCVCT